MSPYQQNHGQGRCELKITNALVVDGTGNPGFKGDVAVESGRISAVGALGEWKSDEVIDAGAMVLAPGFIDVHTHDDMEVLKNPSMDCKVSQGVTTVIAGNCGISIAPVSYSENMPAPFPILGQPWQTLPSLDPWHPIGIFAVPAKLFPGRLRCLPQVVDATRL